MSNLPVPSGPRAPKNFRWLWWVAPPAAITIAYRTIPPRVRGLWNPDKSASSHTGLANILAGGGWSAFISAAIPWGMLTSIIHPARNRDPFWRG